MVIYIMFLIMTAVTALNTVLVKKFQQGISLDTYHFIAYNVINATIASIYFFFASGFKPEMNIPTLIYSFLFAVNVCFVLILNICVLSQVSVAIAAMTSTAGSIVISALFGICILGENVSLKLIFAIILMFIAVIIPYINLNDKRIGKLWICIAYFISSGTAVILSKLYAKADNVCDVKSFFLMTNLIILFVGLIAGIIYIKKNRKVSHEDIVKPFSEKQLINIALRTALSNISSVLGVMILTEMNVSVYTIFTSSLGIISSIILSKYIFHERLTKETVIALFPAIAAIILSSI